MSSAEQVPNPIVNHVDENDGNGRDKLGSGLYFIRHQLKHVGTAITTRYMRTGLSHVLWETDNREVAMLVAGYLRTNRPETFIGCRKGTEHAHNFRSTVSAVRWSALDDGARAMWLIWGSRLRQADHDLFRGAVGVLAEDRVQGLVTELFCPNILADGYVACQMVAAGFLESFYEAGTISAIKRLSEVDKCALAFIVRYPGCKQAQVAEHIQRPLPSFKHIWTRLRRVGCYTETGGFRCHPPKYWNAGFSLLLRTGNSLS